MQLKKLSKILAIILLITIIMPGIIVQADGTADLNNDIKLDRVFGEGRVETSIKVSQKAYSEEVDTLLLAGYAGDADALTATFLAGKMKAPLLLADKENISPELLKEIKRLNPKEIILLGGKAVLSESIEDDLNSKLKSREIEIRRIYGGNRVKTGINIIKDYYKDKEIPEIFLVEYDSLVDALSIGPVAARDGIPVLITGKNTVPKEVKEFLKMHHVKKAIIVGGRGTVSKEGENELKKHVDTVERIFGEDRIKTSIAIADKYFEDPRAMVVANGWKNTDALIGGYFAAIKDAPIVLTSENKVTEDLSRYISSKEGILTYVLGGESVVGRSVYKSIDELLGGTDFQEPTDFLDPALEPVPDIPDILTDTKDIEKEISKKINSRERSFTIKLSPEFTHEKMTEISRDIRLYGNYQSGALGRIEPWYYEYKDRIELTFDVNYQNTDEQDAFINREVERIIGRIINPKMNDYQKVKEVHDYIINNTKYSKQTKGNAHSAYTLLKEGRGVCQAYALVTCKFLDILGIENYYVTGTANNGCSNIWGEHVWNLVKVNGEYYNLDVTWDDPNSTCGRDYLIYDYFLISDGKINKDHRRKLNHRIPKANSKTYEK